MNIESIERVHDLVGNTDPRKSHFSTIRYLSKDSIQQADQESRAVKNLVHAPRSKEEAIKDISIWFKNVANKSNNIIKLSDDKNNY